MRTLFPEYTSHVLSDLLESATFDVNAVNANGESALAVIAQREELQIVDVFNADVLIEGEIDAKHKQNAAEILSGRDDVHADAIARLIDGGDAKQYFMFRRVYEGRKGAFFAEVTELAETASDID